MKLSIKYLTSSRSGIALILGLALVVQHCQASTSAATSTAVTTAKDPQIVAAERSRYVKSILAKRLEYVQNGKRTRDFAKFVRQQKGDMTIFSMHGVDADTNNLEAGHRLNEPGILSGTRDPFPSDRLLLDLGCFCGHLWLECGPFVS